MDDWGGGYIVKRPVLAVKELQVSVYAAVGATSYCEESVGASWFYGFLSSRRKTLMNTLL